MGVIHHLDVGCADASIIKGSTMTFLIDCHDIEQHVDLLRSEKHLRGVFITHQHSDHFSGLEYLRRKDYVIDCLIYSPYRRRPNDSSMTTEDWEDFNNHVTHFKRKGTKIYRPYRQSNWNEPWWKTNGVSFWMIGPPKGISTASDSVLHDACLVVKAQCGKRACLFAGDASDKCLRHIAGNTNNFCNDILHASHHGSLEGADLSFIKKCNAEYTVLSTRDGVNENIPHPTALRRYRENTRTKVYRTDEDGSLKWSF